MKRWAWMSLLLFCSFVYQFSMVAHAAPQNSETQTWQEWVRDLRSEALSQGIEPVLFDDLFRTIKQPDRQTLRLDRKQPETRLTYTKYRNTRGDAYRIRLGENKYKKNQPTLEKVGEEYGVSPCIIVSLWGMESSYGHYLGTFPIIKSLATLAYDPRRSEFFRKELLFALHILNDGHITTDQFVGEWAGGSGHPQFLPSSWHRFAVDYDQDGYKDIWTTKADVFASIANYLAKNGWQSGEPWYFEVTVPSDFDESELGKKNKKTVSEWKSMGVQRANGEPIEQDNLSAAIIKPYGGPYMMIFKNFKVIKRYNNSTFYAGTIGYMADKICNKVKG